MGEAKMKAAMAASRSKNKRWSKVQEKSTNLVMFDKPTYEKMLNDVPKKKLITAAVLSEQLKVNGSVAREAIRHLEERGLIQQVGEKHAAMRIHTRKIGGDA